MKKLLPFVIIALLFIIVIIAIIYARNSATITVDFHNDKYSGAKQCQDCHEEQYKSWNKTYHSSMTQEATAQSVVGDFDGIAKTYWGFTIRPVQRDGYYYFEYINPETKELINTLQIKRTVGSRRYQQYLAQTDNTDGNYYRLELLWHIGDKRWVHMNGAFLGSDHQAFDNHTTVWNQNCIFCHNTGVQPRMQNYDEIIENTKSGKPLNMKVDSRFESHVSDLGIGCESCHANGQEHIELNQNPVRKYYLHYSGDDDKSIINPSKLSATKSMDICGQCHGQRTPKSFELARTWMEEGPTYRPGDDLQEHINPVEKQSLLNNRKTDTFAQRFWKDGTPRLSAYEYQGLLQSQCHIKGELTCNDCHSMHDGNPKGMITQEKLSNKACLSCHENYEQNLSQHTGHQSQSDGSLCYNCHMPKIVYGIMSFHRSHKIESPNPSFEFNNDKPNACAACHLDKSDEWISQQSQKIWPKSVKQNYTKTNIIQTIYKLHSGDPVERGIAASNIAYKSELLTANDKRFLIPHLLFSMEDSYPAIRRFSFQSLRSIINDLAIESSEFSTIQTTLKQFDFIADHNQRTPIIKQAWRSFDQINKTTWKMPSAESLLDKDYKLNRQILLELRTQALQDSKRIEIGE